MHAKPNNLMVKKYDFLIIGGGVAGMSFALKVAREKKYSIALCCKTSLSEANTAKAQGGIASVTNLLVDDFEKHIHDTMVAGDWISDPEAVRQVVTRAPEGIRELVEWGVNFDKKADGSFDLHREGGHSEFRILHHADDTGFEIQRGLMEAVRSNPYIDVLENHFAVEIITQHHLGVRVTRRTPDIECYEEFPVNYLSLKKRQCKWTQGNLEYMRKYNHEIKDCKMLWFEKLDLMLSHYSLPIVPILSFMLVVFTILLGFLGYPIIHYSIFIYCLMVLFLCSPLIPDLFVYKKDRHNIFLIIPYFLLNIVTYASLAPMMIRTVFLGLFGKKATFLVTPKEDEKFTLTQAILGTADSLIFASAVLILCVLCCGSGAPVVLIVTSSMLAPFVVLISNIRIGKKAENEKNRKILLKNLPVPNLG